MVPPVPLAQVVIDRDAQQPAVAFSWKVEYGAAPWVRLLVKPRWLYDVARPGFAVLGGYPVLDIGARDSQGRPAEVTVVNVGGWFDPGMHGWRAWGETATMAVTWPDQATPVLARQRAASGQ